MYKKEYFILGVMSGTSLDGIDLAYVHFIKNKSWTYKIICAETVGYNFAWEKALKLGVESSKKTLEILDVNYTNLLGKVINDFILKNKIYKIDSISSHGHTILHQPQKKITLQIGNLSILSGLIQQDVVCDFRVQDVNFGGQGAPLVPIGDKMLFSEYTYCVNLGGFSNISKDENEIRIAYDVCPVNIVLNHYVQKTGVKYDDKGNLAATGEVCYILLEKLNAISFYSQSHPKSLGLEWVKSTIFPLIDVFDLPVKDILRTYVEHIAFQIGQELVGFNTNVIFTGGGVYNMFLMKRIKFYSDSVIEIPNPKLIEFKEALIFAFLGVLKLRGEVNVLASVTGAKENHSSGNIFSFSKK